MIDASSEGLRGHLEQAVREGVRPPHPEVVAPVLEGRLDPTARASENRHGETISAELRSVESALAYYTVEGLFIALTPLGMIAVAHAMLQCLSGDHGELPEGVTLEGLDPWGEIAPFQALRPRRNPPSDYPVSDGGLVTLPLLYEGPDFYCPDCRRLLVHVREDGRFDIAAKSELVSEAHIDLEAGLATALVVEAICGRHRCRLRRFLRDPRAAVGNPRDWLGGFFPVLVCWAVGSTIGAIIALALRP